MLQNKALQHRLRVSEWLRDADKHKDGTVRCLPPLTSSAAAAASSSTSSSSSRTVTLRSASLVAPRVATVFDAILRAADPSRRLEELQDRARPPHGQNNLVSVDHVLGLRPDRSVKVVELVHQLVNALLNVLAELLIRSE